MSDSLKGINFVCKVSEILNCMIDKKKYKDQCLLLVFK